MGHMDPDPDHEEKTYTIKVYWPHSNLPIVYHRCTEIESDAGDLTFIDANGKHHQLYGAKYEVEED